MRKWGNCYTDTDHEDGYLDESTLAVTAGRKRLRWWKLKDKETKEKLRRNLVERLSNIDEATTENVEQWWEEIAEQIKKCGEEPCGRSTGKKKTGLERWWWNDGTEIAVREKKKEILKIWKRTGEENDKVEYKIAKGKAKRVVARVKADAIEGLYDQLETVEGQLDIYRFAFARDRSGKDICQIRNVKSATGEVLMKDEEMKERWGQYFNLLINKENQRVGTEKETPTKQIH